jgi:hypothetical protein
VKQIQWLLHFQFLPVFPESRQRILHENLELQTFGSQPRWARGPGLGDVPRPWPWPL